MLPQTNLQLYRLLLDQAAPEADLALAREAYDLARQLFSTCYRPSHKPFVAHLIGVSGALALWGEPMESVVAGMLHSAYLYGDYGDGARGATETRRRITRGRVGDKAEQLIYDYTMAEWKKRPEQLLAEVASGRLDRTIVVMKLADVCDDCGDAGPQFATGKPLEFGLPGDRDARQQVLELVGTLVGAAAKAHFQRLLSASDGISPPAVLRSSDRSFHVVGAIDASLGLSMVRRVYRLAGRVRFKKAA